MLTSTKRWLILLLAPSFCFGGEYVSNAFTVTTIQGELLLSNRDVHCVKLTKDIDGKDTVQFTLSEIASRFFQDYTSKNKGKKLQTMICSQPKELPAKIMSAIAGGRLLYGPLTAFQIQCLKDSFDTDAKCKECPVCKN